MLLLLLLPLWHLSLYPWNALAYNLDVRHARIFRDPVSRLGRNSYFGYSVALYASGKDSLLLVGAPRANSSFERAFVEPGAVYRCPLANESESCAEWRVDGLTDQPRLQRNDFQVKDHAWLGASLQVENSTTPRVAICAPRWKKRTDFTFSKRSYLNGMCYSVTAQNPSTFSRSDAKRYFPLSNQSNQIVTIGVDNFYDHGMGQAGFSVHLTPKSHNIILGGPGVAIWKGSTMIMNEKNSRNNFEALMPDIFHDSQFERNDYFGYSITSGCFYKPLEILYASGAPRSTNTRGKVFIFAFPQSKGGKLFIKHTIEGEQYGEYFGSSLASCDINSDGRDDLIIGAPLWSKDTDEGRIYAYVSKGQTTFDIQRLDGEFEGARFGTAVSCLGDLDRDGYADVAVGAPYEDDQRGAVYVYNGCADGLHRRHTQKIRAVDLSPTLRGFGVAIAEPRDVDGNRYDDVAVGAYLSDQAVLLRTRPVVTLSIRVSPVENFTLTENSTHFVVDACSVYDGAFAPDTLTVSLSLEIDKFHKRAIVYQKGKLFGDTYKVLNILNKGQLKCIPVKTTLKRIIQNVIDPIEMTAHVMIDEDASCLNCPVINPILSKTMDDVKLAYTLDCGDDDVCISDLHINIINDLGDNSRFIIGSKASVNISIFIENTREPAYRAQVHVYIPQPITLARIPPQCDEQSQLNKTLEIICNIGNPLRYNNTIVMQLDMSEILYTDEFKEIQVNVTTQSEENNVLDNIASLTINYDIDADIAIIGKSYDDSYLYLEKNVDKKNFQNFSFNHVYEIQKFGTTPIDEAVLIVNVPTHWKDNVVAKVNQLQGSIDGRKYSCEKIAREESNLTLTMSNGTSSYEGNNSITIPYEMQTFYVNCTDHEIVCQTFRCILGPFIKVQSMAKLTVMIDLQLSNITAEAMKSKDVILFVSEGFVEITQPNVTIDCANKRPHFKQIATIFFSRHETKDVAIWIIVLSVLLGIVLVILMSLLLYKLGFFNRRKKEDLGALKPTEEVNQVTSSNENIEAMSEGESVH